LRLLFRLLVLAGLACAVAAATPQRVESTHLKMIVGLTDDTGKWVDRQEGMVKFHRDLGLMAVRVTVPWKPGQVKRNKLQGTYIHRIARMIQLHDRVVLAVYNTARFAPTTPPAREQYCSFVHSILKRVPLIHDVEVWNEANSPTYWPQDNGGETYTALLAHCYDTLHRGHRQVNVISSTASRHDPAGFIFWLSDAYRARGRTRPIFDTFGHNPYPEHSAEPPWATHADSDLIGQGDYQTLMNTLETAFDGTRQPIPGTRGVTIWYVEDGFQTVPAPEKRRFYHGRENDRYALPAVTSERHRNAGGIDQATQLKAAIRLAFCQPAVSGFLNFELLDEDRLAGWQSGLLWRDRTRKPSYDVFKELVAEVRRKGHRLLRRSRRPRQLSAPQGAPTQGV
jgi:hypothetical protein